MKVKWHKNSDFSVLVYQYFFDIRKYKFGNCLKNKMQVS